MDPKEEPKPEGEETLPGEGVVETTPNHSEPSQTALENAELKGRISVLESLRKEAPKENVDMGRLQALSDANNLTDEDYQSKYKFTKSQVQIAYLEKDLVESRSKNEEKIAKLEAHQVLASEFGADYLKVKSQVEENLELASPEVKRDPEKLARFLKTSFLAIPKDSRKEEKVERKDLKAGFEKPTNKKEVSKVESDEVPAEFRDTCKKFGITSEKERKQLMSSDECVTEFGDGYVLRDSTKGFERIEKVA